MTSPTFATHEDYLAALREAEAFFETQPEPGTPEAERFELLVQDIVAYEDIHCPISAPDPAEAIAFRMEQAGISFEQLARALGAPLAASEILSKARLPTLREARVLHRHFGIPLDSLSTAAR